MKKMIFLILALLIAPQIFASPRVVEVTAVSEDCHYPKREDRQMCAHNAVLQILKSQCESLKGQLYPRYKSIFGQEYTPPENSHDYIYRVKATMDCVIR